MAGLCSRRFVAVLANANARLGVDVDRYSFIVVDLHHLLLAGLPAHFESSHPSQAVRSLWAMSGLGNYAQQSTGRGAGSDVFDCHQHPIACWQSKTRSEE